MEDHALVAADSTGVIRVWSPGAEKLFGHPATEAVGRTLDLIVPEEFRAQHWQGFRHAMEAGTAKLDGQPTEVPVRCADGAVMIFPGSLVLLRNAERAVIGAMVIFGPRAK